MNSLLRVHQRAFRGLLRMALSISILFPPIPFGSVYAREIRPVDYADVFKGDPLWDEFVRSEWTTPKIGPFAKNDPLLDEDPFFLRSQKWAGDELKITAPLKFLFENDEYRFYQATSTELFEDKAANAGAYGEGLFFIDKTFLKNELRRRGARRPVPVFYLPLPGDGWTKKVSAVEIADAEVYAFANADGETETMDSADLHTLAKVYANNYTFAVLQELRSRPDFVRAELIAAYQRRQPVSELPFAYPARGSTALFGAFFTGLNLDYPSRSLHPMAMGKSWSEWLLPRAHADSLLTPDVLDRLIVIGQITGIVFVTSVLSKYTILKKRNAERRAQIEKNEDKVRRDDNLPPIDRTRLGYRVRRELREWVDYFSHGLSTISSLPSVATGYLLEYGADRFLGPDSRINRGVRKFLENTFLYARKQNENILVNAQTFYLGVLILGGIDTAGVVLQLLFVSPLFFPWVAQAFGENIEARVTAQFSGKDSEANNIITSEIMRNLSAYFVSGAYSYSSQQRQKIMEDLKPVIENQMRREGKNPYDPANESELNRRIEAVIERMLVERGLPSRKEFLFSGPTLMRAAAHLMGFKVDRDLIATDDEFVLEKARWGLISHTLKRAEKTARYLHQTTGNPDALTAARILAETKERYALFTRMLKRPFAPAQNIKEAVEVRKMLTVLSYEGEIVGGAVKYLHMWKSLSPNTGAVCIAAQLFRQGLFSLIQNKPYLLQPDAGQLTRYLVEASREVDKRIDTEIAKRDQTPIDRQILQLEIVKEKIMDEERRREIQDWKPPKMDWLERRQAAAAHRYALDYVAARVIENGAEIPDPRSPQWATVVGAYREAYRRKMAQLVGLHERSAAESDVVKLATEAAAKETESNLTSNPGLARYYGELTNIEKFRFSAHLFAKNYLEKYMQLTVSNSSVVSLVSPEQPGRFQKFRQLRLLASDRLAGRWLRTALRTLESPMDNSAFQPGIPAWLRRNIPFYGDLLATYEIKKRTVIPVMTAGYLANYFLWQVKWPWDTAFFFFATGTFTYMASFWLDRIMINNGIRPMDTTMDKVKYSMIYTWLTYPTYIPFFFFLDDFKAISGKTVEAAKAVAQPVVEFCQRLLGG